MMTSFRSILTEVVLATAVGVVPLCAAGLDAPANAARLEVSTGAETAEGSGPSSVAISDSDSPASHTVQTDAALSRSQTRFESGRAHYFQADFPAAKRDFDAAVDTLLNAPDSLPDHHRIERRLEELCDLIYRFDIEKLGAGQGSEEQAAFDKAPIDEISHMTFPVDETLAARLKSELNQTSSGIPLELADPVLSYVHYFSSERGRKILLSGFRRSGRYKAMIERIFVDEGVPPELIYLAQAESGFLPRAVSYKNAVGMWQFISGTASLYELTRTSEYDDRLDPEKSTRAAARYLRDLYARYGDWYLAMAAYNCGAGVVDRAVDRTGYADYWELLKRHVLPKETSNYVPIILAMTIMAKHPQDYGMQSEDVDPPVDYDTIQVSARTNLNLLADATLQPVSAIRELNPALLRSVAPAGFSVHVPKGTSDTAQAALENVPAGERQSWRLHHVLAGDTLESIASSYHLPADRIVAVNRGADSLEAGDVLVIPAVFHDDTPSAASHSAHRLGGRSRSVARGSHAASSGHLAASRHVPAQVLHRKAAVRTASR
jgi:membrane-bound lytic murein transglycosylase D